MNIRIKYFLIGALFGMCFPIGAGIFELSRLSLSFNAESIRLIHQQNLILYMIDSAPLFLGLFALIGGVSKEKSVELIKQLKSYADQLTLNTSILKSQTEQTLSQYSISIKKLVSDYATVNNLNRSTHSEVSSTLTGTSSIIEEISEVKNTLAKLNIYNSAVGDNNKRVKEYLDAYLNNVKHLQDYFNYLDDFSRQIEILAINSAIEANKHGSEGKAFLVFSQNIHDMANETKKRNVAVLKLVDKISEDTIGLGEVSENERENISSIIEHAGNVDSSATQCSSNIQLFIDSLQLATDHLNDQNQLTSGFSSSLEEIKVSNNEMMDQLEQVVQQQIALIEEMSALDATQKDSSFV